MDRIVEFGILPENSGNNAVPIVVNWQRSACEYINLSSGLWATHASQFPLSIDAFQPEAVSTLNVSMCNPGNMLDIVSLSTSSPTHSVYWFWFSSSDIDVIVWLKVELWSKDDARLAAAHKRWLQSGCKSWSKPADLCRPLWSPAAGKVNTVLRWLLSYHYTEPMEQKKKTRRCSFGGVTCCTWTPRQPIQSHARTPASNL